MPDQEIGKHERGWLWLRFRIMFPCAFDLFWFAAAIEFIQSFRGETLKPFRAPVNMIISKKRKSLSA